MTIDERMERVGFPNTNTGGGCRAYFWSNVDADRSVVDRLLDHLGDTTLDRRAVEYVLIAHPEGCWVPASLDEEAVIQFQDGVSDELLTVDVTLRDLLPVLERQRTPRGRGPSGDLRQINDHRRALGLPALDPAAAGWSDDDVRTEAERLRRGNPTRDAMLAWW